MVEEDYFPDEIDGFFRFWDAADRHGLSLSYTEEFLECYEAWSYQQSLGDSHYESVFATRAVSCRNPDRVKDVDDLINEARSGYPPRERQYFHEFEMAEETEQLMDTFYTSGYGKKERRVVGDD